MSLFRFLNILLSLSVPKLLLFIRVVLAESCKNAFHSSDGSTWDYVVNCAGETKSGQTDPVYKEGILKLSLNCAKESAAQGVKHYVELSSGNMHSSEKTPHKENGAVEPWTFVAKWKREVCETSDKNIYFKKS